MRVRSLSIWPQSLAKFTPGLVEPDMKQTDFTDGIIRCAAAAVRFDPNNHRWTILGCALKLAQVNDKRNPCRRTPSRSTWHADSRGGQTCMWPHPADRNCNVRLRRADRSKIRRKPCSPSASLLSSFPSLQHSLDLAAVILQFAACLLRRRHSPSVPGLERHVPHPSRPLLEAVFPW